MFIIYQDYLTNQVLQFFDAECNEVIILPVLAMYISSFDFGI